MKFNKNYLLALSLFTLISCGTGESEPPPPNKIPIAVISYDTAEVHISDSINLEANKSYDSDGDSLTYEWKLVSAPDDSETNQTSKTQTSFVISPTKIGVYIFELTVYDSLDASGTVTFYVDVYNNKPESVIISEKSNYDLGQIVSLSSNSFDVDDDEITYSWSTSIYDNLIPISDSHLDEFHFLPKGEGNYFIQLKNDDPYSSSLSDNVTVIVNPPNKALLPSGIEKLEISVSDDNSTIIAPGKIGTDAGIYRSINGGEDWEFNSYSYCPRTFVFSKATAGLIYASGHYGCDRNNSESYGISTDNGVTWNWKEITLADNTKIIPFKIDPDPLSEGEIWALSANILYKSIDNGEVWEEIPIDLASYSNTSIKGSSITHSNINPDIVYLTVYYKEGLSTILRSVDNGITWALIEFTGLDSFEGYTRPLTLIDTNDTTFYAGQYYTEDAGQTWKNAITNMMGHRGVNAGYVYESDFSGISVRNTESNNTIYHTNHYSLISSVTPEYIWVSGGEYLYKYPILSEDHITIILNQYN